MPSDEYATSDEYKCFNTIYDNLHEGYTSVAEDSMLNVAKEIPSTEDIDGIKDITASFDGSWQRNGYSSMDGVVTSISEGKVIDIEILSKVYQWCK